jgi:hypothetical protein
MKLLSRGQSEWGEGEGERIQGLGAGEVKIQEHLQKSSYIEQEINKLKGIVVSVTEEKRHTTAKVYNLDAMKGVGSSIAEAVIVSVDEARDEHRHRDKKHKHKKEKKAHKKEKKSKHSGTSGSRHRSRSSSRS